MVGRTVLVEGSDSGIGRALVERFRQVGARVVTSSRRPGNRDADATFLDLSTDLRGWRPPWAVDVAVLCAAVTSLRKCADDPQASSAVNVSGTLEVARALLAAGAFVIFPSTSLVFDGTHPRPAESDPVNPRTEYGRQKAQVERLLLDRDRRRVAVLRYTKIIAPGLPLFEGWLQSFRSGQVVRPFEDLRMAPVSLDFALDATLRVAAAGTPGVLHVSSDRDLSYAEAARHLASRCRAPASLVEPVRSDSSGAVLESIPLHAALDTTRMTRELGLPAPPPTDALEALLPR